jgi:hypothetical protein
MQDTAYVQERQQLRQKVFKPYSQTLALLEKNGQGQTPVAFTINIL